MKLNVLKRLNSGEQYENLQYIKAAHYIFFEIITFHIYFRERERKKKRERERDRFNKNYNDTFSINVRALLTLSLITRICRSNEF